jgi:hypothetical protein
MMLGMATNIAPPSLPELPRGFAWWYVDIVGGPEEAVVLLWSRRLPFVPMRQDPSGPGSLAIALAVYRGGREHFYALKCCDAGAAREVSSRELRIGKSRFQFDRRAGDVRLRADLDLSLTSSGRVQGVVEVEGAEAKVAGSPGLLDWMPVTAAAAGRASLDWDQGSFELRGPAYFDGNAGTRRLDELGIDDWRWGRIAFSNRDLIYFQLTPDGGAPPSPVVLSVDRRGRVQTSTEVDLRFIDGASGWFGLPRAEQLMLRGRAADLDLRFTHQVEDGFFYQRYLVTARAEDGEIGHGVAERVVPRRLAAAWHRPLVRMRIDHADQRPSIWHPLFSGSRHGRFTRLLRSWWGAGSGVRP